MRLLHIFHFGRRLTARRGRLLETLRHPSKVLVHTANQEDRAGRQQQDDDESRWSGEAAGPGVAEIVLGKKTDHARVPFAAQTSVSRTPAKRSSSGVVVSTSDRASSKSSVGHALRWTSIGTLNQ